MNITSDVSHNNINGNITELFNNLGQLTELDLSHNQLNTSLPLLSGTPNIRSLLIRNNFIFGSIHPSYTSLLRLAALFVLFCFYFLKIRFCFMLTIYLKVMDPITI